ncbi:glycosyl hydrolase family 18 protein [Cohnella terricola]|uniref:chitinase n=1 Tax=Cohnella terricola TaxID=1289167 RepID=A0A559JJ13_9BACL|nr:glycosyl hydrolase family 18 protein [Cohnella terricola]TVX99858.1 cellulase family glycosylhydrolase [Cohnella terricola]
MAIIIPTLGLSPTVPTAHAADGNLALEQVEVADSLKSEAFAPFNVMDIQDQAICTEAEWDASSIYVGGQHVVYNGNVYEAKWWTQGDRPDQSGPWDVWKVIGPCSTATDNVSPESSPLAVTATGNKIIAYMAGWVTWNANSVKPEQLTHINYAFSLIRGGKATLSAQDGNNLRTLTDLKSKNPSLKVLLSIGGWGADGFSDAALTDSARTVFADSVVSLITAHRLDGVDLDWEYPTNSSAGIKARPEDKQNFTLMIAKLREKLNAQGAIDGKSYLVTIAAGASNGYLNGIEINKVTPLLDWINLMTYDFHGGWDRSTGHHTNLYSRDNSVDAAVKLFKNNGVPANKLVVGGAFYGRGWTGVTNSNNGLNQPVSGGGIEVDYTTIANQYLNKNGYTRYWDNVAQAPYLFNGSTFITYDDPQSLKLKTQYVKNNELGGIMFWEYSNDRTGELLGAIYSEMNGGGTGPVIGTPSTPSNVRATAVSANSITLTWTASTDTVGVSGYDVNYSGRVQSVTGTSATINGLNPNTQYVFTVTAKNTAGRVSPASAPLTVSTSAAVTNGMKASDFLKTNGTVIRNNSGTGSVVNLRGTNLGGWMLQEGWMSPLGVKDEWTLRETLTNRFGAAKAEELIKTYQNAWLTTKDLDRIKDMGMNVIRVPILYLELMDKYGNWRPDAWNKLDWLVKEAADRGIYTLLDLHGTFGAQNTFDNSGEVNSDPQLWKNTTYQDRTVRLWEGIATHFKGNPAIAGYDLLNEPDRVGKQQLNQFYDRLYKAIRAIDPDHTIYMEAAWDWNQLSAPSQYGWTNVVYEMHYYAMQGNEASSWTAQNNLINGALQGMRNHQRDWNVPIFVGEFCLFDFNDLWERFLGEMNASNISWTNWTYKVTANYGNWGYYNNNTNPVPNINTDSADTIASKWSKFNTENFRANTTFQNLVKKYTSATTPPQSGATYSYLVAQANQKIVSADNNGTSPLVANRDAAEDWELFEIINNSDGTISLKSKSNNKYVAADLNEGAKLIARSDTIQQWEKFRRVTLADGNVALQALANNKYVTADMNNGGVLVANRDAVGGAWEAFSIKTRTR